jgi:hypothetical protein
MISRSVVALVLCGAVLGGCTGDPADRSDMSLDEQFEQLMARPDLETARNRYSEMQEQVRAALREEFALSAWVEDSETSSTGSGCADYPDIDGLDAGNEGMAIWVAEGGVVERWPEAVGALREVAVEYGFDEVTLDVNEGGRRMYEVANDQGAKLTMGSAGNTTLSLATGCHLRPEAKERGRPITKEEAREIREERDRRRSVEIREERGG